MFVFKTFLSCWNAVKHLLKAIGRLHARRRRSFAPAQDDKRRCHFPFRISENFTATYDMFVF
jgi:hypothetical protein